MTKLFKADFRQGLNSNDWNVWLLKVPRGRHPRRDLNLPENQWANHYLKESKSLIKTTEGLRFTVHPNDAVVAGDFQRDKERAEIGRIGFGPEGKEGMKIAYSLRLKLPKMFNGPKGGRDFVMLCQSHTDYNSPAHDAFPRGWTMHIGLTNNAKLKLIYGLNKTQTVLFPFPRDIFRNLTVVVKWSQKNDGFAQIYLGKCPATKKIYGPNMPTRDAMEFKIGLYRGHNFQTTDSVIYQRFLTKKL